MPPFSALGKTTTAAARTKEAPVSARCNMNSLIDPPTVVHDARKHGPFALRNVEIHIQIGDGHEHEAARLEQGGGDEQRLGAKREDMTIMDHRLEPLEDEEVEEEDAHAGAKYRGLRRLRGLRRSAVNAAAVPCCQQRPAGVVEHCCSLCCVVCVV